MTQDREAFLDRWSRLKRDPVPEKKTVAAPAADATAKAETPAALPLVQDLKPESDFTPFMNPGVEDGTRRSALKKLFTDARYNVPDPFEAYSEDYTRSDPIPEAMLKAINEARDLALRSPEKIAEDEKAAAAARPAGAAENPSPEAPGLEAPADATATQEPSHVAGQQDA
jgi:hypothetical protein